MSQYVTPPKLSAQQVTGSNPYACPLCIAQTTSDQIDIGWVICPMLNQQAICYGCCIDYQGVASSDDFENHPFRNLFEDAASIAGKTVGELRSICLKHQEVLLRPQAQT